MDLIISSTKFAANMTSYINVVMTAAATPDTRMKHSNELQIVLALDTSQLPQQSKLSAQLLHFQLRFINGHSI